MTTKGVDCKRIRIWGESKNFLKKVSFSRPNPHSLLQKLLFPSDCGRNQMGS
jgi:hypothetical protein